MARNFYGPTDHQCRATFTVRFDIEVCASTPEHAARIARDIALDPTAKLYADVLPHEYVEEAEEWFPTSEHGWSAYFGEWRDGVRGHDRKPLSDPVKPTEIIGWERVK